MTPDRIRELVEDVTGAYDSIQHEAWDGERYTKTQTEMWIEASQLCPPEWREIIRVLAQGGEYYSIQWPC